MTLKINIKTMANTPPYWMILAIAIISLTLFMVSDPYAMYIGQHNFSSGADVDCTKCHDEIHTSVISSQASVLNAHTTAAGNSAYIAYLTVGGLDYDNVTRNITTSSDVWLNPFDDGIWGITGATVDGNLDRDYNGISGTELCLLCHSVSMGVDVTHAATIRLCDDDRCHGNKNNVYNDADIFTDLTEGERAAGNILSQTGRIHRTFYLGASKTASSFSADVMPEFGVSPGNIIGSNASRGFNTCIACHSTAVATTTLSTSTYGHTDSSAARQRYMPTSGTFNM